MLNLINGFIPMATFILTIIILGFSIFAYFRKTEKDRFDELEREMEQTLFRNYHGEMYGKNVPQWFASVSKEYQKPKYKAWKEQLYWKMRKDGRLEVKFDLDNRREKTEK